MLHHFEKASYELFAVGEGLYYYGEWRCMFDDATGQTSTLFNSRDEAIEAAMINANTDYGIRDMNGDFDQMNDVEPDPYS